VYIAKVIISDYGEYLSRIYAILNNQPQYHV